MMFSSTKLLDCTGLLSFLLDSILTVASDSSHFSSWSATGEQTPDPVCISPCLGKLASTTTLVCVSLPEGGGPQSILAEAQKMGFWSHSHHALGWTASPRLLTGG